MEERQKKKGSESKEAKRGRRLRVWHEKAKLPIILVDEPATFVPLIEQKDYIRG